jgi:luciferase family oxidoreductase group 1
VSIPPLSVLDLTPVAAGREVAEALQHTTELAKHVESLGYRRFWVAEHHNMPSVASSAPAVLIAHLAANTSTIRVGSGGVMLPNHAPLVVAEQFGTLESLYPGRIDLGVGRAPGTDRQTAFALRRSADGLSAENFPAEFADVIRLLAGAAGHVRAVPTPAALPEIWLLGSSDFSARLAARLGLPFCFAHHFSSANTDAALQAYRGEFRQSVWLDRPHAMISVSVTCAETDERAEELARPGWLSFLSLTRGRPIPLPSVAEAARYRFDEQERAFVADRRNGQAIGSPETVGTQLAALIARTRPDELMLTGQIYDLPDRLRSYELAAAALAAVGVAGSVAR